MARLVYPDFFNDVFGPIMQPGSSGGFAGPVRIGNAARALAGDTPKRACVLVPPDYGDLSQLDTFMTDRGYIGGLLGYTTDDPRLFDARAHADAAGLEVSFDHATAGARLGTHEVLIRTEGVAGAHSLVASSVGGGMVEIRAIDGFPILWTGDTHVLLAKGPYRQLQSLQRMLASHAGASYLDGHVVRHAPGESQRIGTSPDAAGQHAPTSLLVAEFSAAPNTMLRALASAFDVAVLPALLPVVAHAQRRPQLFKTIAQWDAVAQDNGVSLAEAAFLYEQAFSGWSRERIRERFSLIERTLDAQIHAVEAAGGPFAVAETPVLPVYSRNWERYAAPAANAKPRAASATARRGRPGGGSLCDGLMARIVNYAMAVNAKVPGTPIVPGPMGTGGGYLFAALKATQEHHGFPQSRLVDALAVAAALGALAYTHTNASGERGCVGESGVCCAMASGAIAYLAGGDARQVEAAASMALQASIGITCDPIPGGREFPCLTRTVRTAVTAPLYADLALSEIDPLIPYHEALQAIEEHYQRTPATMLCGSECGCNRTPTARECQRWLSTIAAVNTSPDVLQ